MSISNLEVKGIIEITNTNIGVSITGIFKPIVYLLSYLHLVNISPILKIKDNGLIKGEHFYGS